MNHIEGFEENSLTLTALPILTIAQSQTPEIAEGSVPDLKIGDLMNSVTKQSYGNSMELIPYKIWHSRAKMPPRSEGNKIECFSPDEITGFAYGKCAQCQFADFNLKDACKKQIIMIVSPKDEPTNLMRLIFWKSNYTVGSRLIKMLQSKCTTGKVKSIYGVSFNLGTKRVKNEASNSYYQVFTTEVVKDLVPEDLFPTLRENFELVTDLRKKNVDDFYASQSASAEEEIVEAPADDPLLSGTVQEDAEEEPGGKLF